MPVWSVGPTTTHACRCFQKYTRQDVHARMSRWIHSTAPVSTLYLVLRISLEDAAWKNTATFSCSCHIREPPGLRHVSLFFAKSRLRHGFQNLGNTQNLVGGDFSFYSTWRGVRPTYPVPYFYLLLPAGENTAFTLGDPISLCRARKQDGKTTENHVERSSASVVALKAP